MSKYLRNNRSGLSTTMMIVLGFGGAVALVFLVGVIVYFVS
ncbi:MAG: hypothetical protein WCV88_03125 [Patescibacteria group bacterium]|jgi:hypothetical protein